MFRWMKERRRKEKEKDLTTTISHTEKTYAKEICENRSVSTYTWIGHASFLLQMNGLNILMDPVYGKRMGFSKRMTEPGLTIEQLPEIDIVVISHGHYDHLEFPTLKKLKGTPTFYVPAGMGKLFKRKGFKNFIEANWWDTLKHEDIEIHFVPAQHWTKRGIFDTNTSHWGGWIFQSSDESYYFVGDTGYFRGFKEIGERYNIETVFMPIGAYEPEWFMKTSHINPEDAIQAFKELGSNTFVPMHYGAYRLADDTGPEALERLINAWNGQGMSNQKLDVLNLGETRFGVKSVREKQQLK